MNAARNRVIGRGFDEPRPVLGVKRYELVQKNARRVYLIKEFYYVRMAMLFDNFDNSKPAPAEWQFG